MNEKMKELKKEIMRIKTDEIYHYKQYEYHRDIRKLNEEYLKTLESEDDE